MAVDLQSALNTITPLLRERGTAIQLYRADFATPDDIPTMRFWAQGEYDRIQQGFVSTDVAIRALASAVSDVVEAIGALDGGTSPGDKGDQGEKGDKGDPGEDGKDGKDGDAGDLIDDNFIRLDRTWSSQKIANYITNNAGLLPHDLDFHTDVDTAGAINGDSLTYRDGFWVPEAGAGSRNIDGGAPDSVYLPSQRINGGGP